METEARFAYRTYHVDASLAEIDSAFARWAKRCRPHSGLRFDPEDSTKAQLVLVLCNQVPYLMNFAENAPGETRVDTYCALGSSASTIRDTIAVIEGGVSNCDLKPLGSLGTGGG